MARRRIQRTDDEVAILFIQALSDLGGKSTFTQIQKQADLAAATTHRGMLMAQARGWIERSGTPQTKGARIALTHDGRATVRKMTPSGTLPGLRAIDPEQKVAVAIAAEDIPNLAPAAEAKVIAGIMTHEFEVKSLRQRVLNVVGQEKRWGLLGLAQEIRQGPRDTFGLHELMHILFELSKQGYVTFRESASGSGQRTTITDIRATTKLLKEQGLDTEYREVGPGNHLGMNRGGDRPMHRDGTDFRMHPSKAQGGPILRTYAPPPEPVQPPVQEAPQPASDVLSEPVVTSVAAGTYPLLEALLDRLGTLEANQEKVARYLDAAAALGDIDPAEAERLTQKAQDIGGEPFTALEVEYLRYAEAHTRQ